MSTSASGGTASTSLRAARAPTASVLQGEAFVAGMLQHLPALTAVGVPSALSYQRLQPGHWAGAYACWGNENREAALRLEGAGGPAAAQSANVEWKSVDGAANPYLAAGVLIAAGLDGLARSLELPPAVQDDPDPGPTRSGATPVSRGCPRRLPKPPRPSPPRRCSATRWGTTCTTASSPCVGPRRAMPAGSTRRRSSPPTAGGTDARDRSVAAPVVDAHCHPWRNSRARRAGPARLRGPGHDDGDVPDLVGACRQARAGTPEAAHRVDAASR